MSVAEPRWATLLALDEDEARRLAEEIAAREVAPPKPAEPRRRTGSRPRSPEAMARRRR